MTTNDLIKIAILGAMQSIANQSVAGISSSELLQAVYYRFIKPPA